jgi:hypothetical protein
VDEAKSHQSVNWYQYFKGIRKECPWSYSAYIHGLIDIVPWAPKQTIPPLGQYQARMWLVNYPNSIVEAMACELDSSDSQHEWLFSYPGYGEYATPVAVLIQQDRKTLADLRSKLQD